jgi:hypothetical protein
VTPSPCSCARNKDITNLTSSYIGKIYFRAKVLTLFTSLLPLPTRPLLLECTSSSISYYIPSNSRRNKQAQDIPNTNNRKRPYTPLTRLVTSKLN